MNGLSTFLRRCSLDRQKGGFSLMSHRHQGPFSLRHSLIVPFKQSPIRSKSFVFTFCNYQRHCRPSQHEVIQCRTLFTPSALGIDAYANMRKVELLYTPEVDKFKKQFKDQVDESVPIHILTRNFKKFVHLVDNVDDDIKLLWRASRLFCTQRERCLAGAGLDNRTDYCIGPVILRTLSYLRLPVVAKEVRSSACVFT